ncbi:MAG: A24 family peptidase, partial [Negativicoccus succinicivorans]|nr:A24 family peptidase [Negativicoccus succinicivorans]
FTPRRGLTRAEWCFGFFAALSLLPGLNDGRSLVGTLVLCGLSLLAALCDARYGVLPRRLSLLLFLAGVAESIAAGHFLSALMASLLAVVVAGVLYGLARGGMGQGDIWYYAALATWLSPLQTLLLLWLAALLGACFGISSRGFSSRCQAIPFGPFLTLAVGLATPVGSWLGYG